ncbi:MAG: hypothetical protein DWI28_00445 [Planctomycetota bacterium]|nr:MAG: hypothetical protein DWI28_00445 [Planctomycetota bacterium]
MSYFKIVNISKEDLALAKKRRISISRLAAKYGVHRATLIKKLGHHGIERYVLRGKRPEDLKVIAVDQKDIDALTAKQTSFYGLVRKYKTTSATMKRSLKKLGVEWQRVGTRKKIMLSAKDKRDFLNSKTTVKELSAKYEVSPAVIERHLSELGREPKAVTDKWLKQRQRVAELRKNHTFEEIALLMGSSRQHIFQLMSSYETWKASVESYERMQKQSLDR